MTEEASRSPPHDLLLSKSGKRRGSSNKRQGTRSLGIQVGGPPLIIPDHCSRVVLNLVRSVLSCRINAEPVERLLSSARIFRASGGSLAGENFKRSDFPSVDRGYRALTDEEKRADGTLTKRERNSGRPIERLSESLIRNGLTTLAPRLYFPWRASSFSRQIIARFLDRAPTEPPSRRIETSNRVRESLALCPSR